MTAVIRWVTVCIAVALVQCAFASEFSGKVVGVVDGDTINVLTLEKELVRVRLSGIDAPEKNQAFGNVAKQKLSDLVFSRSVVVEWHKKDRYGRVVGKVLVSGADANLQMVELGLAWHYRKYMKEQPLSDRLSYMHAEATARAQRVGLWREANPVAPWEHRRAHARHRET